METNTSKNNAAARTESGSKKQGHEGKSRVGVRSKIPEGFLSESPKLRAKQISLHNSFCDGSMKLNYKKYGTLDQHLRNQISGAGEEHVNAMKMVLHAGDPKTDPTLQYMNDGEEGVITNPYIRGNYFVNDFSFYEPFLVNKKIAITQSEFAKGEGECMNVKMILPEMVLYRKDTTEEIHVDDAGILGRMSGVKVMFHNRNKEAVNIGIRADSAYLAEPSTPAQTVLFESFTLAPGAHKEINVQYGSYQNMAMQGPVLTTMPLEFNAKKKVSYADEKKKDDKAGKVINRTVMDLFSWYLVVPDINEFTQNKYADFASLVDCLTIMSGSVIPTNFISQTASLPVVVDKTPRCLWGMIPMSQFQSLPVKGYQSVIGGKLPKIYMHVVGQDNLKCIIASSSKNANDKDGWDLPAAKGVPDKSVVRLGGFGGVVVNSKVCNEWLVGNVDGKHCLTLIDLGNKKPIKGSQCLDTWNGCAIVGMGESLCILSMPKSEEWNMLGENSFNWKGFLLGAEQFISKGFTIARVLGFL